MMSLQHTTQLNDYTSSASMDAFFSRPFRWRAPLPFNVHPRSENQLTEGTLAGLMQNPSSSVAQKAYLDLLDGYYKTGHQGKEFGTSSHSPHWYRPQSVALWWGIEHRDTHPDVLDSVLRWWSCDQWVRDRYRVPAPSPLAGRIIGWGARFNNNGENEVRNVIDKLMRLVSDGIRKKYPKSLLVGKSQKFFDNAKIAADTFPCLVMQTLVSKHADILSQIKPEKPVIAYDLDIVRTSDALTCTCRNPDAKDPHIVNVDYTTGKVTIS